jgi:hypothetical protein
MCLRIFTAVTILLSGLAVAGAGTLNIAVSRVVIMDNC